MNNANQPATSPNDHTTSNAILGSGVITQALGVTAGIFGFLVLLKIRPYYMSVIQSGWVPFLKLCWPIGGAFLLLILSLICWVTAIFLFKRSLAPHVALKFIYFAFIWLDIILLGFLVWNTGGPNANIFLPIFLLIPAVVTCYCHPKGWFFWAVIIAVSIIYAALLFIDFGAQSTVQVQPGSQTSQAHSFSEYILSGFYTIFCIGTAAFCYWQTYLIRNNHCKENSKSPHICNPLYL